jgi:hypothetical protein
MSRENLISAVLEHAYSYIRGVITVVVCGRIFRIDFFKGMMGVLPSFIIRQVLLTYRRVQRERQVTLHVRRSPHTKYCM